MVKIPEKKTTITAIYRALEAAAEPPHRAHLGASILGDPCRRKLWYHFRWCTSPQHSGRTLRLFRRGQLEEQQLNNDLRAAGVEVYEVDPETGEQFRCTFCNGHGGGSMDAAGIGFVEAPKSWHVIEYKTHGDKSFKALCKDGVEKSKPLHWAQMQLYMGMFKMKRAFYLAVSKNDDSLYGERVHFDHEAFDKLIAKAQSIIDSPEPLERLSEKPEWYECKWCDHRMICHHESVPEANCRTCLHATPADNGAWRCEAYNTELTEAQQRVGCDSHLFIPALIPYAEATGADDNAPEQWVKYRMADGREFYNRVRSLPAALHEYAYTSSELHHADKGVLCNDVVEEFRVKMNGVLDEHQAELPV